MPQIESLGRTVTQQATMYNEARGPIVGAGRINVENGERGGNFGVVHRLSNKATLTVTQRPQEAGDVQIEQHP